MTTESFSVDCMSMYQNAQIRMSFITLVNAHFMEKPDIEFVQKLLSDDFLAALDDFVLDGGSNERLVLGFAKMRNYLAGFAKENAHALSDELGVDRTRLYRGVAPNYGPKPPYETAWTPGVKAEETCVLRQLAEIYSSSGLSLSEKVAERIDYLGIELEYYLHLIEKERDCWQLGNAEEAAREVGRQREFFFRHLHSWVPRFVDEALGEAKTEFYQGHLTILKGILEEESAYLDEAAAVE